MTTNKERVNVMYKGPSSVSGEIMTHEQGLVSCTKSVPGESMTTLTSLCAYLCQQH